MLIILVTAVFCLAQNLVLEASEWLVGMETNAAILALSIFTVIVFRVRSVERAASLQGSVTNRSFLWLKTAHFGEPTDDISDHRCDRRRGI